MIKHYPLIQQALYSQNIDDRYDAIMKLSRHHNRQAQLTLMNIILNRSEDAMFRAYTIQALSLRQKKGFIAQSLRNLIFDETEELVVRAHVIEFCFNVLRADAKLSLFQKLLEHPAADIRFWTVFALTNMAHTWHNISSVFDKLDKIVAFDDDIPKFFGWHVHREALAALEYLYFRRYCGRRKPLSELPSMRLISHLPEYDRFSRLYRDYESNFQKRPTVEMPKPSLFIEKEWLREQLQLAWQEITFQVRPNSQAYQLSWIVRISGQRLLGGLHRDGYAVVVTGADTARNLFICWYRTIISHDHPLFLYEWAGMGVELFMGITPHQIQVAESRQYDSALLPKQD